MKTTPRSQGPATRRRVLAWAPAVAWAALIFAASAQPNLTFVPDAGLDFIVRKIGHAGVFGILALLLWYALAASTRLHRPWAWAIVLTVLYAISDELHQGFTSGRHPSPVDVLIDSAGVVLAVGVGLAVVHRRARKRRTSEGP